MQLLSKTKAAFTMLELIFVIIILGIVSSIGAEIIAKVYEQYITQRAIHKASLKTELAALQIANRLRNAIPGTVYRIKTDDTLENIQTQLTTASKNYKGLQWVGSDVDSFNAIDTNTNRKPGWSGVVDIDNASTDINSLTTPGSKPSLANMIIGQLSNGNKSISNAYIYFPQDPTAYRIASISAPNIINLTSAASKVIQEHYKLAWSSYALVVEGKDLNLYYNFSAIPATARGNTKQLLLKNVVTFKFKGAGQTLRFKLCVEEEIGSDYNITACKEKAVF